MRYEPKTTPFPHQAKATLKVVRACLHGCRGTGARGYALFMEPRTGKSKAALDAVAILHLRGEVDRVAILCPKVALEVWDQQIKLHFPFRAEIEDHEATWVRNRGGHHAVGFYLLGYERARGRNRRGRRWLHPYLRELEAWQPDLLVLDESHRLKRAGGVTARALWRVVARARKVAKPRPYVVLLSGTPSPKGKIDLFAQFRIIDERILGSAKSSFEDEHVVYSKNPKTRWKITRYKNERKLDRRVRDHSFSISAEAAGLACEQFTQNLSVQLPRRIKEKYDELAEFYITQIENEVITGANSGAVRTRLLQLAGGFTTSGVCLHRSVLDKFHDFAEVILEHEDPLLVYCRFRPEVDACVVEAERLGFAAFPFQGSTSDHHRRMALQALRSPGRRPTCIVFQVQAGSLALDLADAAEVVFYSLPDGWEAYWQARNRVLGPRQKRAVRFTHFIPKGTVVRSVLRSLIEKEGVHAEMMNSPRRYLTGL